MRTVRATFAALLGAFVALALYVAWFFQLTHFDPWNGASHTFIAGTMLVGAACGALGGFLAAQLAPETPRGAADGVAFIIAAGAAFAEVNTPGQHHFAQGIALLVAAPFAYAAGRFQRSTRIA